jgi:hypothetical protein
MTIPTHATKTYRQLHESYTKDKLQLTQPKPTSSYTKATRKIKFKNNDQSYQHYTNLHKNTEQTTQNNKRHYDNYMKPTRQPKSNS